MKRMISLLAAMAVLAVLPSQAHAQRRGNGTVNTPFGQFNMRDMQAAGGDPFAAEQLREQKMALQYQQHLLKQQQQYSQQMAKQQKARQDYLKKHPEEAKAAAAAAASTPATAKAKQKNAPSGTAKASGNTAKASKNATDSSSAAQVPGAPTNSTKAKF